MPLYLVTSSDACEERQSDLYLLGEKLGSDLLAAIDPIGRIYILTYESSVVAKHNLSSRLCGGSINENKEVSIFVYVNL
jgi:hypothetical protein